MQLNDYSQDIFAYHLYKPVKRHKKAGMHINGSKAARKSAFIGILSSRELTTPQYDAPEKVTRTTKAK